MSKMYCFEDPGLQVLFLVRLRTLANCSAVITAGKASRFMTHSLRGTHAYESECWSCATARSRGISHFLEFGKPGRRPKVLCRSSTGSSD